MINPSEIFDFHELSRTELACSARWVVPNQCAYFEGHFPNNPILPAVAIIDGSLALIQKEASDSFIIKKAKFLGLIQPGLQVHIQADLRDNTCWDVIWRNSQNEILSSLSIVC